MGRLFESPVHLLILLLVIVVLFGAKRLPDAARGLGRSMRILKSEVRDLKDEEPGTTAGRTEAVEGRVLPGETSRPVQDPAHDPRRDA